LGEYPFDFVLKNKTHRILVIETPPFGGVSSSMHFTLCCAYSNYGFTKNTKPTLEKTRMGKKLLWKRKL